MALIAWYPLNGDTKDYSGNNNHIVSGTYTEDVKGKIGKCFVAGGTFETVLKTPITTNKLSDNVTISFWIFNTRQAGSISIFGNKGNDSNTSASSPERTFNYYLYPTPTDFHYSCSKYGGVLEDVVPYNQWTHITTVQTSKQFIIYINGIKKRTVTISSPTPKNDYALYIGGGDNSNSSCKFNDVRIYNEALSAKQIKEIAQAKICHYTFNEELYENTTNLYDNKNKLSIVNAVVEWENTHALKCEIAANTKYAGLNFNSNLILEPLTTYTLSYKLKKVAGQLLQIRGHVEQTNFEILHTTINGKEFSNYSYYTGIDLTDSFDTYEIVIVFNTKEDITSLNKMYIQPNAIKDEYVKVRIWDIQVEKKDHATPFTTNSRSQVLKDISGYGYDMTTYNQYSPIWNKDDSSNKIKNYSTLTKKDSYSNLNFKYKYPDAFTFSCWVRTTDNEAFCLVGFPSGNNTFVSLAINNYGRISLHSYLSTPDTNGDKWYAGSTTAINDGEWHFVAATYDGTTAKSYIDGKYEASSTVTFDFERQAIYDLTINMRSPDSNWGDYEIRRYEGDISDVRVYATALSAEDIKLLYQPEISIDKTNVIRCSEINEREMTYPESIEIVSRGYGTNQDTYKVSIGDRFITKETAVGWCVTTIDIDNNITHKTFRTHGDNPVFLTLKQYVESIPATSTILLSTFDQPSAGEGASSNNNCMTWINYLRGIGATKIDGTLVYRAAYSAIIQENKIIAEAVDNSGDNSNATLNTVVNLKLNKKGFSKDASITYNEFNEIPNIESGVHNLKLGNEILPVLIDMDNDEGRWARVFYHNCKSGTVLFSSANSYAEAKETNINAPTTSDKYSILSKLESFRPNTNSSFEFKLKYPTDTDGGLNKWTMKHYSNVTLASAETYPLLSDIEGLTPTSETIIEDTNNFIPSLVGDYYIRHYKTKVYSSIAKNINFQIKSDDGVTCYVNNNIAFQKKTSTFNDVKISLNKGWNILEFLYYENAGQDYLTLNQKISELVDILDYNGTYNDSNIWKQTSNPTYEKIAGYTPVKINWTSNFWGGLEWTNGSTTLIDGSVNHGNWYYAIGVSTKHGDGMPSSADIMKNTSTPNDVELWVRINNYDLFADNLIENVSISRNGILTAKEFREIY